MEPQFDMDWYKKFHIVMNALDNVGTVWSIEYQEKRISNANTNSSVAAFPILAARRYVNTLCLSADIPLIESGTEGYEGQATVIKKVTHMQF